MRRTAAAVALLIGPGLAWGQPTPTPPVPPRPPQPARTATPAKPARPQASKPANPPGRPARTTPVVRAKPGAPAQRPAPRPQPHPPPPPPMPEPEKPAEPSKGSNTGQPLPRFAALRSEEVNLRTGPGVRYPIEWVYKRRDLPVQIEREFEVWRLIRDQEGVKGWVHQATLAPRRTAVVTGAEQTLRTDPADTASPVARMKPGVILRLRSCEATSDWCQAQVQDYRGWVKRSDIWGTFPNEAVQ